MRYAAIYHNFFFKFARSTAVQPFQKGYNSFFLIVLQESAASYLSRFLHIHFDESITVTKEILIFKPMCFFNVVSQAVKFKFFPFFLY